MSVANFHFHTSYSDGQCSPCEAVSLLVANGYDILIKTDHDTVNGCSEAALAAVALNVTSYNGIEITSDISSLALPVAENLAAHILGLGIDTSLMSDELSVIQNAMSDSLHELVDILIARGYPLRRSIMLNGRKSIGNKNIIARELVDIQAATDMNAAYIGILNTQSLAHYNASYPSAKSSIDMIHRCGGVAILAHPFTLKGGSHGSVTIQQNDNLSLINQLTAFGLDGIEAYYLRYDNDTISYLSRMADKMGLMKSVGSDLHTRAQSQIMVERYDDAMQYSRHIEPLLNRLSKVKY